MSYEIKVSQEGRGGTVFYVEDEKELPFDWEFSTIGAYIFVPTPESWDVFCESHKMELAKGRRQEILETTGREICRRQTFNGTFQIGDNWLEILF